MVHVRGVVLKGRELGYSSPATSLGRVATKDCGTETAVRSVSERRSSLILCRSVGAIEGWMVDFATQSSSAGTLSVRSVTDRSLVRARSLKFEAFSSSTMASV
jgi:hypothetical protein